MGKKIDRIIALAVLAVLFYLLFMHAFGSILIACAFSFVCCALVRHLRLSRSRDLRMSAREAESILFTWAYADDAEAEKAILELIEPKYPDARQTMLYLAKHPSATLSVSDVFSAWKKHKGEPALLIASTCHADGRARTYAGTLSKPSVQLADASKLIPLIRRSALKPQKPPVENRFRERVKRAFHRLPTNRSWKKSAGFGLFLLPVYLLTGNPAYLFIALGVLFLAGLSRRIQRGSA